MKFYNLSVAYKALYTNFLHSPSRKVKENTVINRSILSRQSREQKQERFMLTNFAER